MNFLTILLDASTQVAPSSGNAAKAAGDAAQTGIPGGTVPMNPMLMIVIYCVVIFGALYFFSIRPQKKRERALEDMRSQISPGDSVLLNSGMFGKVVDVTAECFIVEFGTNKGILIPVLKQEVLMKKEPNLSNKAIEPVVVEEKKSMFGFGKKENKDTKDNKEVK